MTTDQAVARQAAQANLIHELVAALKEIVNADTAEWDDPSEFEAWAKDKARAAIAKVQQ